MKMIARRIIWITLIMTMLFSSVAYADFEDNTVDFEEALELSAETTDTSDDVNELTEEMPEDYSTDEDDQENVDVSIEPTEELPEDYSAYEDDQENADEESSNTDELELDCVTPRSGNCGAQGDNVTWTLDEQGCLTISGSGEMCDYGTTRSLSDAEGIDDMDIRKIIINSGITYVSPILSMIRVDNLKRNFTLYEGCYYLGNTDNPYYVLYRVKESNRTSYYIHPDTRLICGSFYSGAKNKNIYFTGPKETSMKMINDWNELTVRNSSFKYRFQNGTIFHYQNDGGEEKTVLGLGYCGAEGNEKNAIWEYTSDGVLTISGTGEMASWTEPFYYENDRQNRLIPQWKKEEQRSSYTNHRFVINSVIIRDGITSAGDYSFSGMKLTSIDIGGSVERMGEGCFGYLWKEDRDTTVEDAEPVNITIHEGVTNIGKKAFEQIDTPVYISFPNSLRTIDECAFYDCDGLSNISFPDSINTIYGEAFRYCDGLQSITLPDSLSFLGSSAFEGCTKLERVTIGTNFMEAEDYNHPFRDTPVKYDRLTYTDDGYKTICANMFSNIKTLVHVDIPEGIVAISERAFESSGLKSVRIPSSVTTIGEDAFFDCTLLTDIVLCDGLKEIEQCAFNGSGLEKLVIPKTVVEVNYRTFGRCTELKELTILGENTNFWGWGFQFCNSLEKVSLTAGAWNLLTDDDQVFEACPITDLIILDGENCHGINEFPYYAFDNAHHEEKHHWEDYEEDVNFNLETITVSSGITCIGSHSFTFGNGTSKTINIPASVIEIEDRCIDDRDPESIDLYYAGTKKQWEKITHELKEDWPSDPLFKVKMHYNDEDLESVSGIIRQGDGWALRWTCWYYLNPYNNSKSKPWLEIYMDGVDNEDTSKFLISDTDPDISPWLSATGFARSEFTKIKITGTSKNPIYIVSNQFRGYTGIKKLLLSHIDGIGGSAFEDCTSLKTVDGFDSSLVGISDNAFRNDNKLTMIYGSDDAINLYNIGNGAFDGTSLKTITLNKSVKSIGSASFKNCENLVIYCYKNSKAHQYAEENNISVYLLDGNATLRSDYNDDRLFQFETDEILEDIVFDRPSTEYNPRLAYLLSVMARAVYTRDLVYQNYKKLGFLENNIVEELSDNSIKYPTYYIGEKKLQNGSRLLFITIHGTEFDNINQVLGDIIASPYFADSTNRVIDTLNDNFSEALSKKNTTYVITGHSLGGAVGNLLAVQLFNSGIPQSRIYNYNYGCPNVKKGYWTETNDYSNIINIGSIWDFVAGYPSPTTDYFFHGIFEARSPEKWDRYGVSYWFDGDVNDMGLLDNLADHNMKMYVDYLEQELSESEYKDDGFRGVAFTVCCPVDVTIFDSKGNPVAGTINNEAYYYDKGKTDKIFVFVNGDKKLFYIYDNEKYIVKLNGTADGTMQYSIVETDFTSGEVYSYKDYEWVDLTEGKEMISTISGNEAVENVQLFVVNEEGEPVKKIEEDGDETVIKYKVSFDNNGHGSTPKAKTTNAGALISEPEKPKAEGYSFEGWFKDKECTKKWNFAEDKVYSDITLYAKWVAETSKPSVIPVKGIKLDQTSATLLIGKSLSLKTTINPTDATNQKVSWKSNKTAVATVSSTGVVKGVSPGSATITVRTDDGGKTASCEVTVKSSSSPEPRPPVPQISIKAAKVVLSPKSLTYNGKTQKVSVKSVTLNGKELRLGTDYTVSWSPATIKKAGDYSVTIKGTGSYTDKKTVTYKVKQAKNPLTVKLAKSTVKIPYKKLKKGKQTVKRSKYITVSKNQGKVTYKKTDGNKKITIDKNTGDIIVKKGLKKGKYTVSVKITAAGNNNYNARSKTKTFTVKVN